MDSHFRDNINLPNSHPFVFRSLLPVLCQKSGFRATRSDCSETSPEKNSRIMTPCHDPTSSRDRRRDHWYMKSGQPKEPNLTNSFCINSTLSNRNLLEFFDRVSFVSLTFQHQNTVYKHMPLGRIWKTTYLRFVHSKIKVFLDSNICKYIYNSRYTYTKV